MRPQATRERRPAVWIGLLGLIAFAIVTAACLWFGVALLLSMAR